MSRVEYGVLSWLAETAVHAGTGQSTGAVDLPIQREGHTQHPTIAASGLKGALRQAAEMTDPPPPVDEWFGPKGAEYAGCIAFSDARLVAFPVRSLWEVFVWVTCPWVLTRLARDLARIGASEATVRALSGLACDTGKAKRGPDAAVPPQIAVEDLVLDVSGDGGMTAVLEQLGRLLPPEPAYDGLREKFQRDLLLVSNTDFSYLVRYACPVEARNVLDDLTKASENLWYEESLPPDSLLYSLALIEPPRKRNGNGDEATRKERAATPVANAFTGWIAKHRPYVQVGGNETVGEGWCRVRALTVGLESAQGGGS